MEYSVVIVDDEKMVINSLTLGFSWEETNFDVVATFQNSLEAAEEILKIRPDVVFSDIKMPKMSGLEMMRKIHEQLPNVKFVFITGYEDFNYVKEALSLGAVDYIVKPMEDEDLFRTLEKLEKELAKIRWQGEQCLRNFLQRPKEENFAEVQGYLEHSCGFHPPFSIAVCIGTITHELKGYIAFRDIRYENHTFFYFTDQMDFFRTRSFENRIHYLTNKGEIKNFVYTEVENWESCKTALQELLNQVYSFFIREISFETHYHADKKEKIEQSGFHKKIETLYCTDNLKELMDVLSSYEELYPVEQRQIQETVSIYNMAMTAVYRSKQMYFEEAINSPKELLQSFSSFDGLMEYLIRTIGEALNLSTELVDLNTIKNDKFKKILLYINQNFAKELSFQNLCFEFSINPSYLSQIFQRELGTTFTKYLTELRVNYAKKLLTTTTLKITEISERVGYDEYFYFSKVFKKYTGMSPKNYRANQEKIPE